jgi:hypothetical protein
MGHIKEPKGIDFIIQSRPLTKAEELAISEHIKNYKLKNNNLSDNQKQQVRKRKTEIA